MDTILLTYLDLLVSLRFKTKELGIGYRIQRQGIECGEQDRATRYVRSNRLPVAKVRCGLQIVLRKRLGPTHNESVCFLLKEQSGHASDSKESDQAVGIDRAATGIYVARENARNRVACLVLSIESEYVTIWGGLPPVGFLISKSRLPALES